ncbi:hypothetical protein [Endozoicomonas sp.]|uniref:hypothetical protein n=1 Tax=Endozoicomonas sp. TaxID=1892382 RepID=UPI003AF98966
MKSEPQLNSSIQSLAPADVMLPSFSTEEVTSHVSLDCEVVVREIAQPWPGSSTTSHMRERLLPVKFKPVVTWSKLAEPICSNIPFSHEAALTGNVPLMGHGNGSPDDYLEVFPVVSSPDPNIQPLDLSMTVSGESTKGRRLSESDDSFWTVSGNGNEPEAFDVLLLKPEEGNHLVSPGSVSGEAGFDITPVQRVTQSPPTIECNDLQQKNINEEWGGSAFFDLNQGAKCGQLEGGASQKQNTVYEELEKSSTPSCVDQQLDTGSHSCSGKRVKLFADAGLEVFEVRRSREGGSGKRKPLRIHHLIPAENLNGLQKQQTTPLVLANDSSSKECNHHDVVVSTSPLDVRQSTLSLDQYVGKQQSAAGEPKLTEVVSDSGEGQGLVDSGCDGIAGEANRTQNESFNKMVSRLRDVLKSASDKVIATRRNGFKEGVCEKENVQTSNSETGLSLISASESSITSAKSVDDVCVGYLARKRLYPNMEGNVQICNKFPRLILNKLSTEDIIRYKKTGDKYESR